MSGYVLLEGGAEFGGRMAEADEQALKLAGGCDVQVTIIPAAAAPDNNHEHAGQTGARWFEQLGARQARLLPLVDHASANQALIAASLRDSGLIYLLGGFPRYLAQTLAHSMSWQAILEAYHAGAVVGGSSAGAMVLCQHYYDPGTGSIIEGLNLVPAVCVIPHHNRFGRGWLSRLMTSLPEDAIIGIDEETGMIDDGPDGKWSVYGKGSVTLYRNSEISIYHRGEQFFL